MRKVLMTMSMAIAAACSGSTGAAQASDSRAAAPQALEQRSYDLAGFDGVSVVGPHQVTVVVGPAFSVSAEGQARTFERTEVAVEDGTLKIRPVRDDRWDREDWRDYAAAHFTVTMPRLAAASILGSGDMTVDRIEGDAFAASVAGSGKLDIAAMRVTQADLSIAGSGDLLARGSARRSEVSITGSGNLMARDLISENAELSITGSGDAELTVNDDANVSIVGSGDVEIVGGARCTVSRLGGGDVTCGGVRQETKFGFR